MIVIKKCKDCNESKNIQDFLGKEICYKCIYAHKKAIILKKAGKCRMCEELLDVKRWIYCSLDCARKGKNAYKHWTQECKVDNKDFKRRFNF